MGRVGGGLGRWLGGISVPTLGTRGYRAWVHPLRGLISPYPSLYLPLSLYFKKKKKKRERRGYGGKS